MPLLHQNESVLVLLLLFLVGALLLVFSRLKWHISVTHSLKFTRLKRLQTSSHLCTWLPIPIYTMLRTGCWIPLPLSPEPKTRASLITRLATHWQHRSGQSMGCQHNCVCLIAMKGSQQELFFNVMALSGLYSLIYITTHSPK